MPTWPSRNARPANLPPPGVKESRGLAERYVLLPSDLQQKRPLANVEGEGQRKRKSRTVPPTGRSAQPSVRRCVTGIHIRIGPICNRRNTEISQFRGYFVHFEIRLN